MRMVHLCICTAETVMDAVGHWFVILLAVRYPLYVHKKEHLKAMSTMHLIASPLTLTNSMNIPCATQMPPNKARTRADMRSLSLKREVMPSPSIQLSFMKQEPGRIKARGRAVTIPCIGGK